MEAEASSFERVSSILMWFCAKLHIDYNDQVSGDSAYNYYYGDQMTVFLWE